MKPKSLNTPKKRKAKCGTHGKAPWNGDFVCIHCNAIWIREPATDPGAGPGDHQFRLQNTRTYLDGKNGRCVCGRDLFGEGGTGRVACVECVAKSDRGAQSLQ